MPETTTRGCRYFDAEKYEREGKRRIKMFQDNLFREFVVDNFAGGGGASTGMEPALGYPVDIAVNHDADAIAMHKVNHPYTRHFQEDVFRH